MKGLEHQPGGENNDPGHLSSPGESQGLAKPRKAREQLDASPLEEGRGETIVFPGELPASANQAGAANISHHEVATPANPENLGLARPQDTAELEKLERRRARNREYMRKWRQKHPDLHRQNAVRWQQSERGREYKREYNRRWAQQHPEQARKWDQSEHGREYHKAYNREYYLKRKAKGK